MIVETIGFIAATLTTACWIPQAVRIIRTRDTTAISLFSYLAFASGLAAWLTYGILIESRPIIVANAVTLSLVLTIIALKVGIEQRG